MLCSINKWYPTNQLYRRGNTSQNVLVQKREARTGGMWFLFTSCEVAGCRAAAGKHDALSVFLSLWITITWIDNRARAHRERQLSHVGLKVAEHRLNSFPCKKPAEGGRPDGFRSSSCWCICSLLSRQITDCSLMTSCFCLQTSHNLTSRSALHGDLCFPIRPSSVGNSPVYILNCIWWGSK